MEESGSGCFRMVGWGGSGFRPEECEFSGQSGVILVGSGWGGMGESNCLPLLNVMALTLSLGFTMV